MITYTISVVYNLYTTQYKGLICINPIINLWPKWIEMIQSNISQKAEHKFVQELIINEIRSHPVTQQLDYKKQQTFHVYESR